jgi:methylenetetrahydrofolate reductase (NADPH)
MLDLSAPFHTFEFFPPRTEAGLANLLDRINRLASPPLRRPVAISVTWGAGGATAERSLELAEEIVKMGFEVVLHLTCTNMPKSKVDHALEVSLGFAWMVTRGRRVGLRGSSRS